MFEIMEIGLTSLVGVGFIVAMVWCGIEWIQDKKEKQLMTGHTITVTNEEGEVVAINMEQALELLWENGYTVEEHDETKEKNS